MRELKINRLALHNFKGIRQAEAQFSEQGAEITGGNGAGKSTMADAFCWLLTGKNADGESDTQFSIKTVAQDGAAIPDIEHTVEGDFTLVDQETGEASEIRLRRAYVEEWTTPAGETERKLRGHHTDYFYNDRPVKKSEYLELLAGMIPSDLLKLNADPIKIFTDVYALLNLPWQALRSILLELTGEVTPEQIAQERPEFAPILEAMRREKATLDDYKTTLGAQRKRIASELEKIPTRIDEVTRATPIIPDYDGLKARRQEIETELAEIQAAATSEAERRRLQFEEDAKIQDKINGLRRRQQEILHQATTARDQRHYEATQARRDQQRELDNLRMERQAKADGHRHCANLRTVASQAEATAEQIEATLATKREEFNRLRNTSYDPAALICPRFGHQCTDAHACTQGETAYNAGKVEALNRINQEGRRLKEQAAKLRQQAAEKRATADRVSQEIDAELTQLDARIKDVETKLASLPDPGEPAPIFCADLPEWQAAEKEIDALKATLGQQTTTAAQYDNGRRLSLQNELAEINRKLGLKMIIDQNEKRVKELMAQARKLGQDKADVEKELALADAFNIAMIDAVEQRVNALFQAVNFRMYKTLVNGTKQPDCVAVVNGVKYSDVNTAGQVNAGLDAIATLQRHYKFTAPIFVDNCESVAELRKPAGAQVVTLRMIAGQPLTATPAV